MPFFISVSRFLTALALCFATSLILPAQSSAQEAVLPSFDSFSYLEDPLFSPARAMIVAGKVKTKENEATAILASAPVDKAPSAIVRTDKEITECPSTDTKSQLTAMDEFEIRLAIDKALSQILKLTVDYGALRNRVSSLSQAESENKEKDQNWFAFGQSGTESEKQNEALHEINQKQIYDRDKQLAVLQARLEATKKRYDNENVARLLAEKRLKVAREDVKKNHANVSKNNHKIQILADQLEKNQQLTRQLKIDLTNEKLKVDQLNAENTVLHETKTAMQVSGHSAESEASPGSISELDEIRPASEWTIQGLEFELGSAQIRLESADNLNKLVYYLTQNKKLNVQVIGYTDSIGSATSNLELSLDRAQAVADYLRQQGVDQSQIKVLAYGEQRPVANNETEAGRVKNRRVAVLFLN